MEKLGDIRRQIKVWEHAFALENGRPPTKEDIKANGFTKELYREYRRLKKASASASAEPEPVPISAQIPSNVAILSPKKDLDQTPTKSRGNVSSFYGVGMSLNNTMELGPTPQANGKVLLIFDIQASVTPPESSPLKHKPFTAIDDTKLGPVEPLVPTNLAVTSTLPFKTPTRPSRIQLFDASPSKRVSLLLKLTQVSSTNDIAATPLVIRQSHSQTDNLPVTPSKYQGTNPETPSRTGEAAGTKFQISPSPLKLHRFLSFGESKKMVNLFNDYQTIKLEIVEPEVDDVGENVDKCVESELEYDNDHDNENQPPMLKIRKAKTQKRTTRNWHMKPRPQEEIDIMEGRNVQEVMKNLQEQRDYHSGEEEESDLDSDEELQRQKDEAVLSKDSEKGKRKPMSMNFKRYKINDPRAKAFKRRRR